MSFDIWILVLMAVLIVWSFLDKIGDARTTEASARLLEAENRAAELAPTAPADRSEGGR